MLEKIKIKNILNHEDTEIDFCPGVNIISGKSHNGKSVILRSVKWVKDNRPQGYFLKPWKIKRGETSFCEMTFEDGAVSRDRNSSINKYNLTGISDDLVAFGSNPPEQVKEFLNIADYSFQGQHDRYFFLHDSPAERSKKINDIFGLSIIDSSISNINSYIREKESICSSLKKDAKTLEFKLKTFANVNNILKLTQLNLNKFEVYNYKLKTFFDIKEVLINHNSLLERIKDYKKIIKYKLKFTKLVNTIKKFNGIYKNFNIIKIIYGKYNNEKYNIERYKEIINKFSDKIIIVKKRIKEFKLKKDRFIKYKNIVSDFKKCERYIFDAKKWLEIKKEVNKIKSKNVYLTDLKINIKKYENIIKNYELIDIIKDDLIELKISKAKIMEQFKVCPLCKKVI